MTLDIALAAEPRDRMSRWGGPLLAARRSLPGFSARRSLAEPGLAPGPLGRLGSLEVRLAATAREIRRAQRLRYKVFYEEMSAIPSAATRLSRRDADRYDPLCDHLLVLDHDPEKTGRSRKKPKVVATCRLLRRDRAESQGGFYSASEFVLDPLLAAHPEARFGELGRACVLKSYRTKKTIELLWQGIWAYVLHHRLDALIGCASLEGTDLAALAPQLAYLHHYASAAAPWTVRARPERHVPMDVLPRDELAPKAAFKALPPLVKAYLRLGATFGDGAVVDRQFGTTDVFTIMPVAAISQRYIAHFGAEADRYAA